MIRKFFEFFSISIQTWNEGEHIDNLTYNENFGGSNMNFHSDSVSLVWWTVFCSVIEKS
jgi:hypothetical protein